MPLTLLLLCAFWVLAGCGGAGTTAQAPEPARFDDYTIPRITSLAELRRVAAAPPGDALGGTLVGAKFVIARFSDPKTRELRFLDGRYYHYHDEWAWFRLLNGAPVPAMSALALRRVSTPAELRRWANENHSDLPSGLSFADGRVYSAEFYERALAETNRDFGTGSVIYMPARAGRHPERWGFELEYADVGGVAEVLVFFELLKKSLPKEVANSFAWIVRSPKQAETATRLIAEYPAFAGRVMSYDAITVPGETIVYTPGIVAGRLRVLRDVATLAAARSDDILLLGALPEYLPQARGVVTSIPQTPLSHLNLLAKNRGIVNAYRGGLFDDPEIANLARSGAPVVLSTGEGKLRFQPITEAQYSQWLSLLEARPPSPPLVDWERAPYVVELSTLTPEELTALEPVIGGKAVGMAHLVRAISGTKPAYDTSSPVFFDVPERPVAITVRAYREHLRPFREELAALLADPTFATHRKLRFLALEGIAGFEQRFRSRADRQAARAYLAPNARGPVAAVVRKGGVQRMIRETPLPEAVNGVLEQLAMHFGHYRKSQGLRFRSSSTVEDVEGSSGAGLYESHTGFIVPRKAEPGVKKRPSLADALRKTWSSYFSVEAFEERFRAGMDHLAGDMAVLVHARFDDELEAANGVFTFTRYPGSDELSVDAQPGATSVTNPPVDRVVRPETTRVTEDGGELRISRISSSSEITSGATVLRDVELRELFALARRLSDEQLARKNDAVPPSQRRRSIVLDFEFRRVARGWPALERGENPPRFVIKQMRPLEPRIEVPAALRASPVPRDVLARARRIETRVCSGLGAGLRVLLVYTDVNAHPDLGYATEPLFVSAEVTRSKQTHAFTHLDQRVAQLTASGLYIDLEPGLEYASIGVADNVLQLIESTGTPSVAGVECRSQVNYAAPSELLRSFL